MAKIINNDIEQHAISAPYLLWQIALVGVALGVIHWCLTALIGRYIDSTSISGDIATILVATLGVLVMIRLHMAQPLIVAVASGLALWGLARWTSGLSWGEIVAWNALLYGLSYTLFSWIARYTLVVPVLSSMALVIVLVRIATIL
jgi:hypothetical protein